MCMYPLRLDSDPTGNKRLQARTTTTSSARHTGFERGLGQGRSTGNADQLSPMPFHTHVHMFTSSCKTHALTLTARTRTTHSDSLDPSPARNVSTYRTRALAQAPRTTPHEYLYTYIGTYHRHYTPSACFTRLTSRVHGPSQHSPSLNFSPHCYPHLRPHREPKGTGRSASFTHQLYHPYISLCNPTLLPLCTALKLLHSWREVPLCQLVPTCPIPPTLGSPDSTQLLHAPYSLPGTIVKIP